MKKTILLHLFYMLVCVQITAYAQTFESAAFEAKKGCEFFPIGESGEFLYYYNRQYTRSNAVKVFIEKFRTSTLELVETKEISPSDFIPKDVAKGKKIGNVSVTLKNHEFRIIFSLSTREETWIYAKVIDENFTKEQNLEIGSIQGMKRGEGQDFKIAYSNDESKILFVLSTSFFKAMNALGTSVEKRYHIECLGYDWASNAVLFTKTLPEDINGLLLNSRDHIIDNKGNVFFLAELSEKNENFDFQKDISIGLLEKDKQECAFRPIDLTSLSSNIKTRLEYLKNDDVLFIGDAGAKSKLIYISLSDPKAIFERSQTFSSNSQPESYLQLNDIALFKNQIYLTFQEKLLKNCCTISRIFVVNLSLTGSIIWEKNVCTKESSYYYDRVRLQSPVDDSGKLHVFYKENMNHGKVGNRVYETVMATIDQNGPVTIQTINTDESVSLFGNTCITTAKGEVIIVKRYAQKRMTLKKVFFN